MQNDKIVDHMMRKALKLVAIRRHHRILILIIAS